MTTIAAPRPAPRTHPHWCRCTACTPPSPADRRGCTPSLAALLFVAGIPTGAAAIAIVDAAIGGPGLAVITGHERTSR
ncbi:hypothetical protein [Stakelama tenebrarum]|uniref:Uncharacterized protein n=1 Tax=Stakelama tenebrarum TaxID=2711215 RepID=A0A6G6Y5F6_9SPHN|nr:hypothetical protein [Sphingosinithalassobacter tenebrarum]QIG80081.1 hypothetical protein G5C33_10015 [Sphingosinithalassobacter tenebrarum]